MDKEYAIITEVGTFGSLNINDPTVKTIKDNMTEEDMNQLIKESINSNASITL